jgi:undecaprenyl diphosphate synthase
MPKQHRTSIPRHIAVIMDGNGRWARKRGLPRTAGHRRGAERVREIVRAAQEAGVEVVTLFAFSTENWTRPAREIKTLMRYLVEFLGRELPGMEKNGIRFRTIGDIAALPESVRTKIAEVVEKTRANAQCTLVLALNYGARQEITMAARSLARAAVSGELRVDDIDEQCFARSLYTAGLPDVDLLIRTSGEIRLSNFLLWQLSYAELYFCERCWPDFDAAALGEAIAEFGSRRRRFGGLADAV